MAKVKLNPMLEQVNGSLDQMVFRWLHGKQVLSKKPDMSKVKWSHAQQAHRQRFKAAVAYAHAAMADETLRAKYTELAAQQGKRPFDMAVSDYFKGGNLSS